MTTSTTTTPAATTLATTTQVTTTPASTTPATTKPATTTAAQTPSDTCAITNNITLASPALTSGPQAGWDGSILAIDAFNASTGVELGYAQTLLLLPFSKGSSLALGSTDTVTLNQTLNGMAVPLYDLIFAQANNLFPVQSVGVMQDYKTQGYDPITLPTPPSTATPSPTLNAWFFNQEISANPSSSLAQQFASVSTSGVQSGTTSASTNSSVTAFFQSTSNYQNVTMASYVLVTSYLSAYAYAWANFSPSYTYYLTSLPADGGAPASAGKVVFTLPASVTAPVVANADGSTNGNAGYNIDYYPEGSSTATPLYFSDGQFVDDPTSDTPAICLLPNYASQSTLSGQDSDWDTFVPVLAGSIYNDQVTGANWQPTPEQKTWYQDAYHYSLYYPFHYIQDAFNWIGKRTVFKDIMGLVGVGFAVQFIAENCFKKSEAEKACETENGGKPATQEQLDKINTDTQKSLTDSQAKAQKKINNAGGKDAAPVPDCQNILQVQQNMLLDQQLKLNALQIEKQKREIAEQERILEVDAQVGVDGQLINSAETVEADESNVEQISPNDPNAQAELKTNQKSIANNQQQISQTTKDDSSAFSATQKQKMNEADEGGIELTDMKNQTDKNAEQKKKGEGEDTHVDDME